MEHNCNGGCDHHHHHHAESSESKVQQAFEKYNFNISDEQVKKEVTNILSKYLKENDTPEVKKFLFNSIELTSLKTTDSEDSIMKFVE